MDTNFVSVIKVLSFLQPLKLSEKNHSWMKAATE